MEVQVYFSLSVALKALEGLDIQKWRNLDGTPIEQITKRCIVVADKIDTDLAQRIKEFDVERATLLKLRHKNVHSLWGFDPEGNTARAIYRRTHEKLEVDDLDVALSDLAPLTFLSKAIAIRVGELIASGVLAPGNSKKAPKIAINGEWVQL